MQYNLNLFTLHIV